MGLLLQASYWQLISHIVNVPLLEQKFRWNCTAREIAVFTYVSVVVERCSLMFCEMLIMCAFCRRACNPVDLFDAAVQKRCLDDFVNIKVIMLCQNNF